MNWLPVIVSVLSLLYVFCAICIVFQTMPDGRDWMGRELTPEARFRQSVKNAIRGFFWPITILWDSLPILWDLLHDKK